MEKQTRAFPPQGTSIPVMNTVLETRTEKKATMNYLADHTKRGRKRETERGDRVMESTRREGRHQRGSGKQELNLGQSEVLEVLVGRISWPTRRKYWLSRSFTQVHTHLATMFVKEGH